MKKNKKKKKTNWKHVILNLIIIVLVFGYIPAGIRYSIYRSGYEEYTKKYNISLLSYELRNGRYDDMIKINHYMHASEVEEKSIVGAEEAYEPFCAIGEYYEKAGYYRLEKEMGRENKAKQYKAEMEKARENMGELESYADEIDTMLSIE